MPILLATPGEPDATHMTMTRFPLLLICAFVALLGIVGDGLGGDVLPADAVGLGTELHGEHTDAVSSDDLGPLPFFYDLYTFRGRGGRTTVVSAFAVEAGRLETERSDNRSRYRFSVTLVLVDTIRRSVTDTHDTVHVDVDRPLDDEHLLYTQIVLRAPPSSAICRTAAQSTRQP